MHQNAHRLPDLGVVQVMQPKTWLELRPMLFRVDERVDTFEWRLDTLGVDQLTTLDSLKECLLLASRPVVVTLRSQRQGGAFVGEESRRLDLLASIVSCSPEWIDIESFVDDAWIQAQRQANPKVQWIRSWHAWGEACHDLTLQLDQMRCDGISLYKLVIEAQSTRDCLHLLMWLRAQEGVIAHCMGEHAQFTRLLARVYGSKAYYCSEKAIPLIGMMNSQQSFACFAVDQLNAQTKVYALLGQDVARSLGPQFHNNLFRKKSKNAVYVAMKVGPHEFDECLVLLHKLGLSGLSITMPYKQTVLNHKLLLKNSSNKSMLSCNTLRYHPNDYEACNTDGVGVDQELSCFAQEGGLGHVALLGLGGLGVIVFDRLCHHHFKSLQLWNRSSHPVTKRVDHAMSIHALSDYAQVDLWISTLPQQAFDAWVLAHAHQLKKPCVVWNMNYNQVTHESQNLLEKQGVVCHDGLGLFYGQGHAQQVYWGA